MLLMLKGSMLIEEPMWWPGKCGEASAAPKVGAIGAIEESTIRSSSDSTAGRNHDDGGEGRPWIFLTDCLFRLPNNLSLIDSLLSMTVRLTLWPGRRTLIAPRWPAPSQQTTDALRKKE